MDWRRWCAALFGVGLLWACPACQKVELPSGGEGQAVTEEGENLPDEPVELPDGYVDALSVGEVLRTYAGIDLEEDYEVGVVGYIVGCCTSTSIGSASFSAQEAKASNVLVADRKDETDAARCLPVELKKGTDVRAINLADHPENLGARVFLYGLVKTYFGQVGLKSVAYHEWVESGGETATPEEELPEDTVTAPPDTTAVVGPTVPGSDEVADDTLDVMDSLVVIQGGRTLRPLK